MINNKFSTGTSVPYPKKLVKVIIDEKGYKSKPKNYMGAITNRMIAAKNACEVNLIQLASYITNGHAFTISYAVGGMSDNNFVSSDLVGLDFDGELTVNEVLKKLKDYHIPANIVYYTYSHGEKGERFRVVTALNETVTNKDEYKQIIKGYQSLFGSNTDNATVGAVQRFLGTNKGLVKDVDPYNTADKHIFLDLYNQNCKTVDFISIPTIQTNINIDNFDLQRAIDNYNLLDYIKQTYPESVFKPASGGVYVNPCPLCGHNDHLHITNNKFHSFGNKACLALGGVGIVQWLMFTENLTAGQAISKFKYNILGIDEKQDKRAYAQTMTLKEKVESTQSTSDDSKKTKDYLTIEILQNELKALNITVKYNIIANQIEVNGYQEYESPEHILNTLPTLIYSVLCGKYKGASQQIISDYLLVIATRNRFNPVLDILQSVKWDGKDHLQDVYNSLCIADNDILSKTLILKWFWQGLALLHNNSTNPYGADGVLTLAGEQGIGKTSFFRKMSLSSKFFREGQSIDNYDKDSKRRCITTWITELGEVDTTLKSDMGMLKAFITNAYDEYRLPYGRTDQQAPRRTNLAATVNGTQFLIDPTGNRRFWTIPLESIDLEKLNNIDALQVWVQVWEQYAKHNLHGFRLSKNEQQLLAERNRQCEKPAKGEDEILDILDETENNVNYRMAYMTISQFKMEHDVLRHYDVKQLGKILDKIGIIAERKSIDGKQQRVRMLPKRIYNALN